MDMEWDDVSSSCLKAPCLLGFLDTSRPLHYTYICIQKVQTIHQDFSNFLTS